MTEEYKDVLLGVDTSHWVDDDWEQFYYTPANEQYQFIITLGD